MDREKAPLPSRMDNVGDDERDPSIHEGRCAAGACRRRAPGYRARPGKIPGYRTECVSAPIIHCRCSAGMWNSLQTIPEPYSSGALSFRLRLLEADANNPST